MEERNIRIVIREFLESINEDWIRRKEKEFKRCPFYNLETNIIEIPNQFLYEPIYGFDKDGIKLPISMEQIPREMKYDFKNYCLDYYNEACDFSTPDDFDYQLIGFCEMEKTGKDKPRILSPNLKMIITLDFIPFFRRYFEASKSSKLGIIRAIEEFKSILIQEKNSIVSNSTKKTPIRIEVLDSIPDIISVKLDEIYFLDKEAHTQPMYSKLTLDFDLDRTELTMLIYVLIKCGFIGEKPENIEACFEYFTFKKKKQYHIFSSKTNLTNLLGQIKKGDHNQNLDDFVTFIQEKLFEIKSTL